MFAAFPGVPGTVFYPARFKEPRSTMWQNCGPCSLPGTPKNSELDLALCSPIVMRIDAAKIEGANGDFEYAIIDRASYRARHYRPR